MHDPKVDECLAPVETHWESWDSGIPALSARPNDGIHLLFYGHSWSSAAPIWPKMHNLSLSPHLSLPYSFQSSLLFPLAYAFSHTFISLIHQPALNILFLKKKKKKKRKKKNSPSTSLPSLCCLFLWLIALMFFLWSTATSSSSELVWPHVFQEGMSRCGGEGPRGAYTAKHQNNMSHSCLMTSTIQPCRALTVHPILRVAATWRQYIFFTQQNILTLLSHDSQTGPWHSQHQTLAASGITCNFSQFPVFEMYSIIKKIFYQNAELG